MNKRNLLNNLKEGRDLEQNLPQYANELMSSYYHYSMIRLSMNYYTFYEILGESEDKKVKLNDERMNAVHDIIGKVLVSNLDGVSTEESLQLLDEIRKEIIKKMKVLTAYIDIFQNYEHVLNRLEYRYGKELVPIDDTAFAKEIVQYIFNTNDNVIINNKIKDIIGQLPVRMTKTKYFELICDSISVYKGAQKVSLDNYLYMLRTSAMLYQPEGIKEYFPELTSLEEELKSLSFKDLNEEDYKLYTNKINENATFIGEIVDAYVFMQEVLNNLYTVILSAPYVMNEKKDISICKDILKIVHEQFSNNKYTNIEEDVLNQFTLLEGRQEEIYEEYTNLETILSDVKEKNTNLIEGLMLEKIYRRIDIAQLLLSSSLFVELDEVEVNDIVDESYVDKITKEFIEELSELFVNSSQSVMRAVIASTISKMPVFFLSPDDVTNYVTSSLNQCKDLAEKYACKEIITNLMID
jgi:hypothetical protein